MEDKPKKLILIDGNAIIHRAYHALPPLTTKKGELVNAVYGFASTILSVIDKFQPEYILATFDLAGPTFRHEEYKDYKATRVKAPDELYAQIDRVKEVVRALGIPIYEKQGFEADDVIGTMVTQAEKNPPAGGLESIIVTGDLDTLQLVDSRTKVYTMRRGLTDSVMYDEEKIKERYELAPTQLNDFKGLRGDPSDNIPGVKGIGEKTAAELLGRYNNIENLYKHLSEIRGATKEKLERDKMQAFQSKKLATIRRDVPLKLDLNQAETHSFDRNKLVALFIELNFYSLIKRIPNNSSISNERNEARDFSARGGSLPAGGHGALGGKYELISEDKASVFFKMLEKEKEIAIKLKTQGENLLKKEIIGMAFSWKTGRAGYVINFKSQMTDIKSVLENKAIKKIGYDLKKDIETLDKYGIKPGGELCDIMVAAYVMNPGEKIEFSRLVLAQLGEEVAPVEDKGQLGLEMDSPEKISDKICREADYILKLKKIYEEKIKQISLEQKSERNLERIFWNIEMPLVKILADMEIQGVKLNTVIMEGISKKIEGRIKNLEESIYELAGSKFNINSSKQLAEILFEKLKLPTEDIKRGKTGYSTASSELEKLKNKHKIISKIEEYREVFKLKTTYLDTLPFMVDKESRIHTSFNQAVTATGRLSSSDPNLQNIPIRTDLGQLLRVAFEAEKGYRFVSADYSQIDLRVVAHVSGDKKMIELFRRGEDIHRATAAEINKIPMSKVTQGLRSSAKALNFGVIYGMSVFGFSQAADIEREEAKKFINEYMKKFEGVANYIKSTKELAKRNGFVETEMGRRRYIPEINSPNFQVAQAAERMAINMPIQGTSADIVKLAMIKVHEEFKNNSDVQMILQIHDEIIWEVKENIAQEVAEKIKEIMQNVYKLKVPLAVNVKTGDNWGEI